MTTFSRAKLKKSDGQTSIDKFRVIMKDINIFNIYSVTDYALSYEAVHTLTHLMLNFCQIRVGVA